MSNVLPVLLRFLALGLLLLTGVANALIPANSYLWGYGGNGGANGQYEASGFIFSTPQASCAAELPKFNDMTQYPNAAFVNSEVESDGQSAMCFYSNTVYGPGPTFLRRAYKSPTGACPANSTSVTGGCACKAGYQENAAKTACEPNQATCTPGQVISSGLFDAGSEIAKGPSYIVCSKGCAAAFDGEFPAGSALVQGKKHYFARGSYANTGSKCDSGGGPGVPEGDGNAPDPSEALPPDTCAPGEAAGVVNGKPVCAPDMTQPGDGTKPPATPDQPGSDDKKTSETNIESQTNPDGSKTVTTTTTRTNVDGTKTTEKTVDKYDKDGNKVSSSTTTTGSGVTKEAEDKAKDDKASKCEKNSSEAGCGGDPKAVDANGLYTKKEATVKGALESAASTLSGSPVGAAVTGFFVVGSGGTCPTATANIPFLEQTITLDFYCTSFATNALLLLRIVLLLVASWMAFRIAIE